ncbi:MAG TPA: L-idonate 5-dehydrogenase [Devosiaceae bacterium]|jgi:L-idonate 5-dehydrogenase|nr:L-idonate 5-dehydrogenase [Devosiaceae bacterium]
MRTDNLAVTLFGAEDLRLVERPLAPLAPGMVRVRFGAGGICGSDLHYFRHGRTGDFRVAEPLVLGHELAGEVVEAADAGSGISAGDRVAVNPSRWCGSCSYCREGRENLCENIYFMGSASKTPHMQGGFAQFVDVTPAQCVRVPASVPFAAAALAEPLAVALHAVACAGDIRDRHVAVFGGGPIGLLVMMAARLAGAASVTVADLAAKPLAFAAELGADRVLDLAARPEELRAVQAAGGLDVVFEASGAPAGLASALATVRRGGRLVQVGNLPAGELPVAFNSVMARELTVCGTFRFGREYERAVDLIATGQVDVLRLVTAQLRLDQAPEALRLALDRSRSVKVMLTPPEA